MDNSSGKEVNKKFYYVVGDAWNGGGNIRVSMFSDSNRNDGVDAETIKRWREEIKNTILEDKRVTIIQGQPLDIFITFFHELV